jgi:hypothetical protein
VALVVLVVVHLTQHILQVVAAERRVIPVTAVTEVLSTMRFLLDTTVVVAAVVVALLVLMAGSHKAVAVLEY